MAATPKKRAWLAWIKANGGFSAIFEKRASGKLWREIAAEIGCSDSFLFTMMGRSETMKAARAIANQQYAEHLAEDGLVRVDGIPDDATREQLERTKQQVAYRRWLASVYDRERFGEPKETTQAPPISIGELHIQALIQGAAKTLPAPAASADGTAVPATPVAGFLTSGPSVPVADVQLAAPVPED